MNDESVIEKNISSWEKIEDFQIDSYDYVEEFYEFIGGSCNCLLLLVVGECICLWNPSTKYIQKVIELSRLLNLAYRVDSGLCKFIN